MQEKSFFLPFKGHVVRSYSSYRCAYFIIFLSYCLGSPAFAIQDTADGAKELLPITTVIQATSMQKTATLGMQGPDDLLNSEVETTLDMASVNAFVQPENLVGKARLSFLFWDVYDAQLYAPQRVFSPDGMYALSLRYLMDFSGPDIAERSLDEMRGQGYRDKLQLDRWLVEMLTIFPDVQAGDELIGVRSVIGESYFLHNGKVIGTVTDPLFADAFFGIWLAPNSSEPKLRKKLLGI
jgi:hypothetical protein